MFHSVSFVVILFSFVNWVNDFVFWITHFWIYSSIYGKQFLMVKRFFRYKRELTAFEYVKLHSRLHLSSRIYIIKQDGQIKISTPGCTFRQTTFPQLNTPFSLALYIHTVKKENLPKLERSKNENSCSLIIRRKDRADYTALQLRQS